MSAYGFALTVDNLANLLTVKMTAYGKDKGEQAKKVKSISTFRAFVKKSATSGNIIRNIPCREKRGSAFSETQSTFTISRTTTFLIPLLPRSRPFSIILRMR